MTRPEDREFAMEIEITADRETVWRAITEARQIRNWFAPDVEVEPGEGGRMRWSWGEHHDWPHVIEQWKPSQHLRTRYDSQVEDGAGGKRPLFVDFFLEGDGGTTTLRLVHSGFGPEASFDDEYDGISSGWPVELRSLRHYLQRHPGIDRQVAWASTRCDLDPQEAWQRLVSAEGLGAPTLGPAREGDTFRVDVPECGSIEGQVLFSPSEREFSGTAANLEDGWFRLHCERWGGATQVWVWLSLYGRPGAECDRFQAAFSQMLDRLYPQAADAARQEA